MNQDAKIFQCFLNAVPQELKTLDGNKFNLN